MLAALLLVEACNTGGIYDRPAPTPDPSGVLHHFFWDFRCRFGPAAARTRDLRIDIELSPLNADPDSIIVSVLEDAGYTVEQPVKYGPFNTVPRTEWPASAPDAVRHFTYPGTGVDLTGGQKADNTPVGFGGVSLLCNSDPGSPDSVSMIAQRLEVQIVTAAFVRRGFSVRVGKKPHDGFR